MVVPGAASVSSLGHPPDDGYGAAVPVTLMVREIVEDMT
jgi:hypothetical protein